MELYDVVVHNELTDEKVNVRLRSECWQDAQVEALVYMFERQGWRKVNALVPHVAQVAGGEEPEVTKYYQVSPAAFTEVGCDTGTTQGIRGV